MDIIDPLVSSILPILSIAGTGYLLAQAREIDVDPLSTISLYILLPALVFHSIATSEIRPGIVFAIVSGVLVFTAVMALLTEFYGRTMNVTGSTRNALVLMVIFPNVGNYGLPLADFAFGQIGRNIAVLFIVTQSVLMYTLGIYIATRDTTASSWSSVKHVFKLPLIYAVVAALLLRGLDMLPPSDSAIMEAVLLTGDAAIPVMLLLLGIQLAYIQREAPVVRVAESTGIKLLLAPVLAYLLVILLDIPVPIAAPFVLLCSMPSAITPLLFLIEFEEESTNSSSLYASSVVFLTTVLSVISLSILILLLEGGIFP